MAINDIIEGIKSKGQEELKALREYYEKKIKEIKETFQKQKDIFIKEEEDKINASVEEIKKGLLLTAKIEARKIELFYKKKLIKDVLAYITDNVVTLLGKERYYNFIKSVIEKYADNGDVIKLHSNDLKAFKDMLSKDISKKLDYKDFNDYGVIIEKKSFNYNFSIKALIDKNYAELEKIIGKKLNVL